VVWVPFRVCGIIVLCLEGEGGGGGGGAEVLQRTTAGPRGCWLGQGQYEYTLNLPKIALNLPKIAIMLWRVLLKSLKVMAT